MDKRQCFNCNRPLGCNAAAEQCRGMRPDTCPKKDNEAALEKGKIREAEFKAWKAKNPGPCGTKKKKGSFKDRINKKVQATVTKALEEQAAQGTAPLPAAQPATGSAAKPAPAAGQGATGVPVPPIPSVAIPQGPLQGPAPQFNSNNFVAAPSMVLTAVPGHQTYYGPPNAYQTHGRFCPTRLTPYWDP